MSKIVNKYIGKIVKIKIGSEEYTGRFTKFDGSSFMIEHTNDQSEPVFTIEYMLQGTKYNKAIDLKNSGNLQESVKFFKESIDKAEKIPESIEELIPICLELGKYKEAAEYLSKSQGKIITRVYKRLKETILKKAPKELDLNGIYFEKVISDYDSAFDEENKGNISTAIDLYKKVINDDKKDIDKSYSRLIPIYIEYKKFDDAIDILRKNTKMSKIKYLEYRIDVLTTKKDKFDESYLKEQIDEYTQYIDTKIKENKKIDKLQIKRFLDIAEYFYAIYEHNLSKEYAEKSLGYFRDFSDKTDKKILVSIYEQLVKSYIQLDNINEVKRYSDEIYKIDKNNKLANDIKNGKYEQYRQDVLYKKEFEDFCKELPIYRYIKDRIENSDIDVLNNKYIQIDCRSISSLEELHNLLPKINNNSDIECFAGLKVIENVIEGKSKRFESNYNLKEAFLSFILKATFNSADFRINKKVDANDKDIDVARYCYLQTILLYKNREKEKVDRQYWHLALQRYIQTYFWGLVDLRKEDNLIYNEKYDKSYSVSSEKLKHFIKDKSYKFDDNVTIGLFELFEHFDDKNDSDCDFYRKILEAIFASPIILDSLERISTIKIKDDFINNFDNFKRYWKRATNIYRKLKKDFFELIENTISNISDMKEFENCFEKLHNHRMSNFINKTDKSYFDSLCDIFKEIKEYNESGDFNDKSQKLSELEDDRRKLIDEIKKSPTYFSYDILLKNLELMKEKIDAEASNLFTSEPKLSISLGKIAKSGTRKKVILNIPIDFINSKDVQQANNLKISIKPVDEYSDKVQIKNDSFVISSLYSGSKKGEILTFTLDNKVTEFPIIIEIKYQYKRGLSEIGEDVYNSVEKISLNNIENFEDIPNPFSLCIGQPVTNEKMFYGREEDLKKSISNIIDEKGDILKGRALAIYGQKRAGKSTILYHLKQSLIEKDKYNIILDLGSFGTNGNDIKGFLYAILSELKNEVKKHNDLVNLLAKKNIEIDPDKILSNPEMCEVIFNRQFKGVCDIVHSCKRQIILMIDEFTYIYDWIKTGIMTDQIMKFWKGLLQNNYIFAVIVGQDNMESFVGDPRFSNDFGTTYMQKVTYLDEKSAKKLMSKPILDSEGKSRYTEEALDYLYELTSGSAFLIMKLCAGLVYYLNEIKSSSITKAHIEEYLRNNWGKINEFDYFDQLYNDVNQDNELNEKNKDIIRKIAYNSRKREWVKVDNIAISEEEKELLNTLKNRDVVEIIKGKCKIKVGLYKEWILATKEAI